MGVLSMGARRFIRTKSILVYCVALLTFLVLWSLFTLVILFAEDRFLNESLLSQRGRFGRSLVTGNAVDDSYMGRGIQVVVGHYNGNLPNEKKKNLTREQLDANNYDPQLDAGEHGRPVKLAVDDEKRADDLWSINQFNVIVSDRIAVNRSLPDVRKQSCRDKQYPIDLPATSIIIVYHNEAFSTLIRTVTSVINRSDKRYIHEIILVDDYSDREFLKNELDDYISSLSASSTVAIKIVRSSNRVGLIRARLMGAAEARGDVLTFLDSHCECTDGWLPPLLARIKEDRKTVVCPVIDVINDRTFAYQKGIELFRGGFNWNLQFRWFSVPPAEVKKRASDGTLPIASPTMAGGLFAIDRKYFEQLGTYDQGMDIWGGENLEISFRLWQCGGRIEILPCSHVGHVFRKASPHDFPGKSSGKVLNSNLVRVAEVWMDEWKHLFYKTAPQALQMKKTIDVSDRIELRKQLGCRDFNWYLSNVWPEHFLPNPDSIFGRIINAGSSSDSSSDCMQWSMPAYGGGSKQLAMHNCSTVGFDRTELWIYTKAGQIKGDEHQCLSATQSATVGSDQWTIQLKECGEYENEYWTYNSYVSYRNLSRITVTYIYIKRKLFKHRQSGLCMDKPIELSTSNSQHIQYYDKSSTPLRVPSLRKCSRGDNRDQQWHIVAVRWLPDNFTQHQ